MRKVSETGRIYYTRNPTATKLKAKYVKCSMELDEKIKQHSNETGMIEEAIIRSAIENYFEDLKHNINLKEFKCSSIVGKKFKAKFVRCSIELDTKIKKYREETGLIDDAIMRTALEYYFRYIEK
jgi:predicted DNA-binding protein